MADTSYHFQSRNPRSMKQNETELLYSKLLKKTYFVTIFYKMQPEDIILLIMPEISSRDNNFDRKNYSSDAFLYNCSINYCGPDFI